LICSLKLKGDWKNFRKVYVFITAAKVTANATNSIQKSSSKNITVIVKIPSFSNLRPQTHRVREKDESISQVQCRMIPL
jgi:hypothetical protein